MASGAVLPRTLKGLINMAGRHQAARKPRPAWQEKLITMAWTMAAQMAGDALLGWLEKVWPWR